MTRIALFTLFMGLVIGVSSCSDNSITNGNTASTIQNGTWRITYYYDTDHEETSSFSGYNFTFASTGVVTATNGTTTVNGTWSTGNDDSQVKLILDFTGNAQFEELDDDWHVIELTDVKIRLEDVSGGGGGTDYLTFEKN